MAKSYQPFPITELKTGLYNYLEPWIRPQDAFDPLSNAYVYRGSIYKRDGTYQIGGLVYHDGAVIAVGNGTGSFSGTLAKFPIIPGSFTVKATTSAGLETWTSNSTSPVGTLTGSLGDTGTITWATGAWTLTLSGGRTIANPINIVGSYNYYPLSLSSPTVRPIMALKTWYSADGTTKKLVACDTDRASVLNSAGTAFDPLYTVSEQIGIGNGGMGPYAFNAGFGNIIPYSFTLTDGTETFTSDGATPAGVLTGSAGGSGTITWASGAFTVTFNANTSATFIIAYSITGDYFTGDYTNFFNSTNWGGISTSYLYLTNNKDPITIYDGTNLSRPPFSINQADFDAYQNNIGYCLDLDVYKNRLIVQRPNVINTGANGTDYQSFRWSAINPNGVIRAANGGSTDLVADVQGQGGELSAPTQDIIQSSEILRDQLIVPFNNSVWWFRFNGTLVNPPFSWVKLNGTKSTDAPYGTVAYDERITMMGKKGLIACDGVNVQRYDIAIVDYTTDIPKINQEYYSQCFATRFDTLNQTWMLYPSINASTGKSDSVLIYNFMENTWATYSLAMSCLGTFFVSAGTTWANLASNGANPTLWEDADLQWSSYLTQKNAPVLLGGGHDGIVSVLNSGITDGKSSASAGSAISSEIRSTRWNPFVQAGQKVQFGYIDIYYLRQDDCELDVSFFVNNSEEPVLTTTITCDSDSVNGIQTNDDYALKRVYLNLTGEFIRMKINSASLSFFQIVGFVLWAAPAGRFTP